MWKALAVNPKIVWPFHFDTAVSFARRSEARMRLAMRPSSFEMSLGLSALEMKAIKSLVVVLCVGESHGDAFS